MLQCSWELAAETELSLLGRVLRGVGVGRRYVNAEYILRISPFLLVNEIA